MKKIYKNVMLFMLAISTAGAQTHQFEWAKSVGGSNNDFCTAITTDITGNVYATGYFQGTVDLNPGPGVQNETSQGSNDVFIIKTDALGNFIWAKTFGGSSDDRPAAIAVTPNNSLFIAGSFAGTADFDPGIGTVTESSFGFTDGYLLQLNSTGDFISLARAGGSGADQITSLTVNTQGSVTVTGDFEGNVFFFPAAPGMTLTSAGSYDVFVASFDMNLNPVWVKRAGGPTADHATAITSDQSGNLIYGGYFIGTGDYDPGAAVFTLTSTGSNDIFISGLTASGNFSWAVNAGGTGDDGVYSLDTDDNSVLAATGYFSGTADFNPAPGTVSNLTSAGQKDVFILTMDFAGQFQWVKKAGSTTDDLGKKVIIGPAGEISTSGTFTGTVDFNPGNATNNISSSGMDDGFVLVLSSAGNFEEVVTYGSALNDAVHGIAFDSSGDLFVAGSFAGTMDADPFGGANPLTPVGLVDGFMVRLGSSFTGMEEMNNDVQLSVYPNPATDYIMLHSTSEMNYKVSIYNATGALVYQKEYVDGWEQPIEISTWPPGIYHAVVEQNGGRNSISVIISGK